MAWTSKGSGYWGSGGTRYSNKQDAQRSQILGGSTNRTGRAVRTPSQVNGWPRRTLASGQIQQTGPTVRQDWMRAQVVTGAGGGRGSNANPATPYWAAGGIGNQAQQDLMRSQILNPATSPRQGASGGPSGQGPMGFSGGVPRGSGTAPIRMGSGGSGGVRGGGGGGVRSGGGGGTPSFFAKGGAAYDNMNITKPKPPTKGQITGSNAVELATRPRPVVQKPIAASQSFGPKQGPVVHAADVTTNVAGPSGNLQSVGRVDASPRDPGADARMAQYKAAQAQNSAASLGPVAKHVAGRGFTR